MAEHCQEARCRTLETQADHQTDSAITQALMEQGFSDGDIAKIMGGNVFRLLRENLPE